MFDGQLNDFIEFNRKVMVVHGRFGQTYLHEMSGKSSKNLTSSTIWRDPKSSRPVRFCFRLKQQNTKKKKKRTRTNLSGTGAARVAEEARLERGQDAVLDARPVDAHFAGVGRAHDAQLERRAFDVFA